jgi:hypothetical protein
LKGVDNEDGVVKEISAMSAKKSSTFYWNNRKDSLKASQELARLHTFWVPGCKTKLL